MMIENLIGEFSDAQGLTAGTTASSNYVNLNQVRQRIGLNDEIWVCLRVNVVGTFVGTETYLFSFEMDDNSSFTSPCAVIVIADSDGTAIVTADPESTPFKTAGEFICCQRLPPTATEKYVRWNYIIANGGTITVDAWLSMGMPQLNKTADQVFASNVTTPS